MSWTQSKGSCWILKTNLDTFFCCFCQKCVNFHLFCWKICKYPLRSFKNSLLSFKIQWDPSNSNGSYWIWFGPISDPIGSNRILSFKIRPDQTQWKIGPNYGLWFIYNANIYGSNSPKREFTAFKWEIQPLKMRSNGRQKCNLKSVKGYSPTS